MYHNHTQKKKGAGAEERVGQQMDTGVGASASQTARGLAGAQGGRGAR